jgi:hypothetical protein
MKRALVVILLLVGCSSHREVADSWKGRRIDDLVAAWGAPVATASLSDGRTVTAYRTQFAAGTGGMVFTYQCEASFVADRAGIVSSVTVNGGYSGCSDYLGDKVAAP